MQRSGCRSPVPNRTARLNDKMLCVMQGHRSLWLLSGVLSVEGISHWLHLTARLLVVPGLGLAGGERDGWGKCEAAATRRGRLIR